MTDIRLDDNVDRPARHDQMLDVVTPYQHQPAPSINARLFNDTQAAFIAIAEHAAPARRHVGPPEIDRARRRAAQKHDHEEVK